MTTTRAWSVSDTGPSRNSVTEPVVGMNVQSYESLRRSNRMMPWLVASRNWLLAAPTANGRSAAPPVPTTNSRMPCA